MPAGKGRRPWGAEAGAAVLADYRKKGLGARVGLGRVPAVLVVDFVRGFTDPASPLAAPFGKELAATARLLAAARRSATPVLFTTVSYTAGLVDGGWFVKKMPALGRMVEGSEWVEVDPGLSPAAGEPVVAKKFASAFFGTALASTLAALGVDTLLVAGCTTSGCVRATVVDAIQHGLRPSVVLECVGDRAARPHEAALLDIEGKYGDVVRLAPALRYLASPERRAP